MKFTKTLAIATISLAALTANIAPANAQLGFFIMADRVIKSETAKAIATPGHADWCARQDPGYRKKWNNWRTPNGRVKYCASPFYTPLWMRGRQQ